MAELPGKMWAKAPKANAPREIGVGLVLGIAAGLLWNQWHKKYSEDVANFYKEYQQSSKQ